MSLLVFQHEAEEDAGTLGQALAAQGHRLRVIRLDAGAALPADLDDVDGVVSMGGSMNVEDEGKLPWLRGEMELLKAAHAAGRPVVGVCLGAQLIAAALGGKVEAMPQPEVGWHPVSLTPPGTSDAVYTGQPWKSTQFHLHGQQVTQLPAEAVALAGSKACKHQAFRVGLRTYGFQYHFEWTAAKIKAFADDPLVRRTTQTAEDIVNDLPQHHSAYRRLGDRLCESIAMFLFPGKRA